MDKFAIHGNSVYIVYLMYIISSPPSLKESMGVIFTYVDCKAIKV